MTALFVSLWSHPAAAVLLTIGVANVAALLATYSLIKRAEHRAARRAPSTTSQRMDCRLGDSEAWAESAYLQHQR